jgi:protein-S-isoprenylcysteine O-methyltransferase Ste14
MNNLFTIATIVWVITGVYWIVAALNIKTARKKEALRFRVFYMLFWVIPFALTFFRFIPGDWWYTRLFSKNGVVEWAAFTGMVLGLAFMTWSRVILGRNWSGRIAIKEDHQLITSGPYSLVRHPMYTGFIFAFLFSVVLLGETRGLVSLVILLTGILMKVRLEEKFVREVFGHNYIAYSKQVKRLIPFIY